MLSMHIPAQDVAITARGMRRPVGAARVNMLRAADNTSTRCYHEAAEQSLSSRSDYFTQFMATTFYCSGSLLVK